MARYPVFQGRRLKQNEAIRARIKELSQPLDEATQKRMEDSKSAIYQRAWELAAMDDPRTASAAVQALKLITELQLLGPEGEKLLQNRDKLDLERERLELQKKQLEAGKSAKDVRIILDPSLRDAIE